MDARGVATITQFLTRKVIVKVRPDFTVYSNYEYLTVL